MTNPTELLDRVPPSDPDAERWVLGSMLLRPSTIDDIGSTLKATDFALPVNQQLYATLLDMRDKRAAIDAGLLLRRLRADGLFQKPEDSAYLGELFEGLPHSAHAAHYAKIVREKSARRVLIQVGSEMIRDAYTSTDSSVDILNRCETALGRIETGDYTGDPIPLSEALREVILRAERIRESGDGGGVMTGIYSFDERFGGLFPGELCILAARTRIGKTALASQIAVHSAMRGKPVYFATVEMKHIEIAQRMLCSESGVNSQRLRTGTIDREECAALAKHSNAMAPAKMTLHHRPALTVNDIRRAARRQKGVALVVIDYLQFVTPVVERDRKRYEQIAIMAKEFHALASELNVPVLCLAQLGRDAEKTGKPELYHLRESGDIEQTADAVLLLTRPVVWGREQEQELKASGDPVPEHQSVLRVEKNRNGETAEIPLSWEATRTRFTDPNDPTANYEPAFADRKF